MRKLCYLLGFIFLATSMQSHANLKKQWKEERAIYKKVTRTKKSQRLYAIKKALPKLGQYPLKPYLEYELLTNSFSTRSAKQVISFQKKHKDSRLVNLLQGEWLSYLYNKKQWKRFLSEYQRLPLSSTRYVCMQQRARLNTKQTSLAHREAVKVWLAGKSQPKVCDPLLSSWKKAGKLTSELALQRFWLAIEARNYALARYAAKFVKKKSHKNQVNRFWKIYNKPSLLYRSVNKDDDLRTLHYGLKRLARKDPKRAVNYWLKVIKKRKLSAASRAKVEETLARRMSIDTTKAKYDLLKKLDSGFEQAEVTVYKARIALKRADWKYLLQSTDKLPEELKQEDIWQYWHAVSTKRTTKDTAKHTEADAQLLALTDQRSYYGFLAATLTQQPYSLAHETLKLTRQDEKRLVSIPAVQRAYEFHLLHKPYQLAREWRSAQQKLSDTDQKYLTLLASKWNWNFRAINSAAQAGAWDLIDARFPNPYPKLFSSYAKKKKIDTHWPVAIARQESAFKANARSRVGARGLMQLMPRTAKQTARKNKIRYRRVAQLSNPNTNINLGTSYLAEMLKTFKGNHAYASAAYNAGPHRVTRWLKKQGKLPLDAWIESIPFKETRRYVKNVLTYRVIYQRLDKLPGQFMTKKEIAALSIEKFDGTPLLAQAETKQGKTVK